MIVDLGPLPYKTAMDLIKWCMQKGIDLPKCIELTDALVTKPVPDVDWTLDIPDKYITFILMNWPTEADLS